MRAVGMTHKTTKKVETEPKKTEVPKEKKEK